MILTSKVREAAYISANFSFPFSLRKVKGLSFLMRKDLSN